MKVCVFGTRGFPYIEGGVEKHCESLYPLLGEDIEIIVFRRKPYVKNNGEYDNIQFVDLPSTKIKGFEALLHSFLATVYSVFMRPDAVHIHNIGPALFAPILKLFSIPVILTYHSPNYEHKKWGNLARKLLRFCESVALKYSDKIIFVNSFQMQKYPRNICDKSVYIPNGIHMPTVSGKDDYLQELGLEREKYILSVGRITPEKGFHTLIEAFKTLKDSGYKLVIAGGVEFENSYMKELQYLSEDVPMVFTGYVFGESLAQLYAHAALFVLASENEGFPLVLLEAMSYGRNLLVSDIPATHLVKLEESDYFPKGDSEILSRKIQEKLKESPAKNYDLTKYSWEEAAKQVSVMIRETTYRKS